MITAKNVCLRFREIRLSGGMLVLGLALGASAQSADLKPGNQPKSRSELGVAGPDRNPELRMPPLPPDSPGGVPALPPPCPVARERPQQLLAELDRSLAAQAKQEAKQYAAKPEPGVSPEKAWGDFAAGAALMGDLSLAAWAGLTAAELQWSGEAVTNAGVYLFYLGKTQDSLQLLTCAHAMGERSPFLSEALATVHHKLGHVADARQAITQANQMAPDDRVIETSASLLTTGQPPPPPPPPANQSDGLDEAIRELEEHAARSLTRIKTQADAMDRSLSDAHGRDQYAIRQTYFRNLLQNARDQARAARSVDARARQSAINSVLGLVYVGMYAGMTDTLLSFPDSTKTFGSPLLFWADVLDLDPQTLGREGQREATSGRESWHTALGPALARGAYYEYQRDKETGYSEHNQRFRACRSNECQIREDARWCGEWKPLYVRWANDSRQRYNKAARSFDRIATQTLISAENDLLQARDFAVRQLKKMKFPNTPGVDMEKMTLQGINHALRQVFDRHLSGSGSSGTVNYVREQASWFDRERSHIEDGLAVEASRLKEHCEPAMQALLELLIQEEWQAYLDHLRDRIAWDIQGQAETNEFPCEGTIGPVTIATDLNKPGEGKMDLKWSRKGNPFSVSGSATIRKDQTIGVGVSVSAKKSWERKGSSPDTVGVSGSHDTLSGQGIGSGGCYGPFCGKARATYTSKVSPWNNREFLGIKLKGSAGLGVKRKIKNIDVGVACYPSNGSVTFYPRALYEDTVRYLSTPATPPGR
jgi:hypothetical protein